MPQTVSVVEIQAPREVLFKLAHDFNQRLAWDSFAKRIRYEQGAVTSQVGLVGAISPINPLRMTVEHINLVSPVMVATNMLRGPFFVSKLMGNWRFDALGDSRTRVTLQYDYVSSWPWLSRVVDPILHHILAHDCRRNVADLARAVSAADLKALA